VVLSGATPREVRVEDLVGEVADRVADGERLKSAAAEVATAAGVSKKDLYDAVLAARSR
jgi:16S rRNA (cytidine1402-2'-O)-methyltransferase